MSGVTRQGWMAFALAVLVILLDQASKHWVLNVLHLAEGETLAVAGPFHLTGVWNRGVSFGLLRADHDLVRWVFVAFSIAVTVILALWVRASQRPMFAAALGLVMGGAVGNAIDRVRYGAVADFLDISRLHFPWVFNVADAAINVGIALLLIDMLRQDRLDRAARAGGDAA